MEEGLALLPRLCGLLVLVSDKGTGRVRAKADGRASISYDLLPEDFERIKKGMIISAEVLLAGGAKSILAPVHGAGEHTDVASFAEALQSRVVADFVLYASHPMSSCRMGLDPATSVIGPTGESHHVPGLFLADSSVFPTSIGVNPQLTTMAMGTVIGRHMIG